MPESLEDLKKRRAQLETTTKPIGTNKPSLDPAAKDAMEEEYRTEWWEAWRKGNPEPEVPVELREFLEWQEKSDPRYQPEHNLGSDPTTFKVGQWYQDPFEEIHARNKDPRKFREALPEARYPNPGALWTNDIEHERLCRQGLVDKANNYLEQIICWRAYELRKMDTGLNDIERSKIEAWTWLSAIWADRNITPPSKEQIDIWATEEWERIHGKPAQAQTKQPNEANVTQTRSEQKSAWDGQVRSWPR